MRTVTYILCWLALGTSLLAQPLTFHFRTISEKDGLSDNSVTFFLKDRKGGMWIATVNGLNYYDGANFKIFRQTADTNSILSNHINGLSEDREGNIWGVTDLGVFCFHLKEKRFSNYILPGDIRMAWNILCDQQGDIWVSSWFALFRFNRSTKNFVNERATAPADSTIYYGMRLHSMLEDPSGNGFWLGDRAGLFYYDKTTKKYLRPAAPAGSPLVTGKRIFPLAASRGKHFWFFNNNTKELIAFDPRTLAIINRISINDILPNPVGVFLFEASDGKLWFGNMNNVVLVIDTRDNNRIYKLNNVFGSDHSIAGNTIVHAYEDEDGTVWLGTSGGISKWNGSKSLYRIHKITQLIPGLDENDFVGSLAEDTTDNSWWFVTESSAPKLVQYHPVSGQIKVYDVQKSIPAHIKERPGPIFKVRLLDRNVLLCTWKGTWQLDTKSGFITPFWQLPPPFEKFPSYNIVSADNIHFFHSNEKDVIHYNRLTRTANKIPNLNPQTLGGTPGSYYPIIKKGYPLWVASGNGWLRSYDNGRMDSAMLWKNPLKESHGWIRWNDIDKDGNVWVAYVGAGLYRYNPRTMQSTRFTEADGLIFNQVSCVLADNNNNIWSADRHKYSVFMQSTGHFYNFTMPEYQQFDHWYMNMSLLQNGNLVASSFRDLVEFFPDRLLQKPTLRRPIISSIQVNGQETQTGDSVLHLLPDENELIIHFGSLTDRQLFPYYYSYMLEGYDKTPRTAEDKPVAYYGNISPGQYTFRVQCIAKDKSWLSPEKMMTIIIQKPFYKTTWFLVLTGLLFAGFLYAIYRIRLMQHTQIFTLENKAESLEKEKAMIQYESLKQQLNPHLLFNSLTSLRSLIKKDTHNATRFLDGMSRTYRYILKSGERELVTLREEVDFVKTFTELQEVRFDEGLKVEFRIEEVCLDQMISPVILQNLVENAIKHNTTSTESPLFIEIFTKDGYVVVKNNLQRYRVVETSNNSGIRSLKKLYEFYTEKEIVIEDDGDYFIVKIPLL